MRLLDIVEQLELDVVHLTDPQHQINAGYASDLLSCVMASAKADNVWVTLQSHPNVIAVASLLELGAVIITEGIEPDKQTTQQAQDKAVNVLKTTRDTFWVVTELAALGVRANTD
jgi:hypothetical protein